MARINRLNYAFSVGKIRVKETRLLTKKDLLAILDLDLKEALKTIVEKSDYPERLMEIKDSSDLEVILDSYLKEIYSLIENLLIEKEFIQSLDDLEKFLRIAKNFKIDFFIDYLCSLSDLLNIKLFFRFKNLKKEREELSGVLLNTGYLKKKVYLDCYLEPWEFFLENLKFTRYASLIKESFEYLEKEGSFLKLEMLIEDFLINKIRPAKYICLGPEPLLAYYLAKRQEINLLRFLILGKWNNLSKDKILERLSDTYA